MNFSQTTAVTAEQQCLVVIESHELASVTCVALKTQNKGVDQRPDLEKAIDEEERQDKQIPVLGVANGLNTGAVDAIESPSQKLSRIVRVMINICLQGQCSPPVGDIFMKRFVQCDEN